MAEPIDRSQCPGTRHGNRSAAQHYGCVCPDAVEVNRRYARWQFAGKAHLSNDVDHRVDATGTRRRIQALYAIGWRECDLAPRLGYINAKRAIPFMHNTDTRLRVFKSNADKVLCLFNELRGTPGPSKHQRARAKRFGWFTPDQWDTADIDDPASTPLVNRPVRIVDNNATDPWKGAVCRSGRYDPELWWAGTHRDSAQAVRICGTCPIQRTCLRYALTEPERYGVWGGLSETKRTDVRRTLVAALDGRPMEDSPELVAVLDSYAPVNSGNDQNTDEVSCA